MKKIMISMAACAMMLSTSCSNEELVSNQQAKSEEFSLTMNVGTQSRTMMKDGKNVWNVGDKIYVFSEDESVYGVLMIGRESDITNGGKTATFRGTVNGEKELKNVVYPAPKSGVPAPADLVIDMGDVEGAEHNAPMFGTIGSGNQMNYVGGLVRFQITGVNEGQELEIDADVNNLKIAGGEYRWVNGKLKYDAVRTAATIHNIPEDGVFYLPVAAEGDQTSSAAITAKLVTRNGDTTEKKDIIGGTSGNDLTIPVAKSEISTNEVPNYEVNADGDAVASTFVYNVTGEGKMTLREALGAGKTNIKLAEDINLSQGFTLNEETNIVLDLNNKKMYSEAEDNGYITSKGKLEIKNGYISSDGTAVYANGGELNLIDCKITERGSTGGDAVYVDKGARVVIRGGWINAEQDKTSDVNPWYGVGVNGGAVTLNTEIKGRFQGGVTVLKESIVNFEGGKYVGTKWHGLNINAANVTINLENKPVFEGAAGDVQFYEVSGTINGVSFEAGIYTEEKVYEAIEKNASDTKTDK